MLAVAQIKKYLQCPPPKKEKKNLKKKPTFVFHKRQILQPLSISRILSAKKWRFILETADAGGKKSVRELDLRLQREADAACELKRKKRTFFTGNWESHEN